RTGFRKSFTAGPPDDTQPDPKSWKLTAPASGGRAALEVNFPKALDHALLQRLLWVIDGDGRRVAGTVRVSDAETRWAFAPEKPWRAGRYRLVIDATLEDLAGNSVARSFELDLVRPRPEVKPTLVELGFEVK